MIKEKVGTTASANANANASSKSKAAAAAVSKEDKDLIAEYAKSSRSACKGCGDKIEKVSDVPLNKLTTMKLK